MPQAEAWHRQPGAAPGTRRAAQGTDTSRSLRCPRPWLMPHGRCARHFSSRGELLLQRACTCSDVPYQHFHSPAPSVEAARPAPRPRPGGCTLLPCQLFNLMLPPVSAVPHAAAAAGPRVPGVKAVQVPPTAGPCPPPGGETPDLSREPRAPGARPAPATARFATSPAAPHAAAGGSEESDTSAVT